MSRTFAGDEDFSAEEVVYAGDWRRIRGIWHRLTEARTFAGKTTKARAPIPDTLDQIFERVTNGLPIQLLKATAWEESRFDPKAESKDPKDGHIIARGIGQVVSSTLKTFNDLNHREFTPDDLYDPEKNAMIMSWLYRFIINVFNTHTGTQRENWDDPDYVGNLMLAYGAGSGTGKNSVATIIKSMEDSGVPKDKINVDTIRDVAMKAFPASKIYNDGRGMMSDPALLTNIKAKLRDYLELRNAPAHIMEAANLTPSTTPPPATIPLRTAGAGKGVLHWIEENPTTAAVGTGFGLGLLVLAHRYSRRKADEEMLANIEKMRELAKRFPPEDHQ